MIYNNNNNNNNNRLLSAPQVRMSETGFSPPGLDFKPGWPCEVRTQIDSGASFYPSSFSLTCLSAIHHSSTVTYLPSWYVTALTAARCHLWSWNWCYRIWLDTRQTPTVCYAPQHKTVPFTQQHQTVANIL